MFKKGQSGNLAGRPIGLKKMQQRLPAKAKEEVYNILFNALKLSSLDEARAYIKEQDKGEYGVILELTCKELTGDNGWAALNDILDRLFGKARISADVKQEGGAQIVISVKDKETADALAAIE